MAIETAMLAMKTRPIVVQCNIGLFGEMQEIDEFIDAMLRPAMEAEMREEEARWLAMGSPQVSTVDT